MSRIIGDDHIDRRLREREKNNKKVYHTVGDGIYTLTEKGYRNFESLNPSEKDVAKYFKVPRSSKEINEKIFEGNLDGLVLKKMIEEGMISVSSPKGSLQKRTKYLMRFIRNSSYNSLDENIFIKKLEDYISFLEMWKVYVNETEHYRFDVIISDLQKISLQLDSLKFSASFGKKEFEKIKTQALSILEKALPLEELCEEDAEITAIEMLHLLLEGKKLGIELEEVLEAGGKIERIPKELKRIISYVTSRTAKKNEERFLIKGNEDVSESEEDDFIYTDSTLYSQKEDVLRELEKKHKTKIEEIRKEIRESVEKAVKEGVESLRIILKNAGVSSFDEEQFKKFIEEQIKESRKEDVAKLLEKFRKEEEFALEIFDKLDEGEKNEKNI